MWNLVKLLSVLRSTYCARYHNFLEIMLHKMYTRHIGGVFFKILLVGVILLICCEHIAKAEEVPAFFLKIAKNPTLPRIGRSGKYENFFYKAEKHIPRIGRYSQQPSDSSSLENEQENYSSLTKRRIDYPSKTEEWTWQNFPLAIEGPRELWRTLAGYSKDGNDDIDNEVWQRKKRTGTMTTQVN